MVDKKVASQIADDFLKFYDKYQKHTPGTTIYVNDVMIELGVGTNVAYVMLNTLKCNGFAKRTFEFRCPIDEHKLYFDDTKYINLPIYINCPNCDIMYKTRDYLFVGYVLK